jgi:hypothetical protein
VKDYLAHMATNVVGDMFVRMDPNASTLAKANAGLKEASSRYSMCAMMIHLIDIPFPPDSMHLARGGD